MTLGGNTSLYVPDRSSDFEGEDEDVEISHDAKRYLLNTFLDSCNVSKVCLSKKRWEEASESTRRSRVKTTGAVIVAALKVIAPGDAAPLWQAVQHSAFVEQALGLEKHLADKKYLEALAETYRHATSWETRRQALSVMADLVPYEAIERYLPGISEYRIKAARKHKSVYGRGVPVPSVHSPRMRIDSSQLDHFLTFITSPHVVQDLPFGQKHLKLSTGDVLETPNVVRSMISERIVRQYTQYCEEQGVQPFGRTTMLNILAACSATTRKSLQGIDYIAAEGSKGFDTLISVTIQIAENGLISRELSKKWQDSLKRLKQYLKIDFKVSKSRVYISFYCSYKQNIH